MSRNSKFHRSASLESMKILFFLNLFSQAAFICIPLYPISSTGFQSVTTQALCRGLYLLPLCLKPAASTPAPNLCKMLAAEMLWHCNDCAPFGYQVHRAGPLWSINKHVRLPVAGASKRIMQTLLEQAREVGSRQKEAATSGSHAACEQESERKIYTSTTRVHSRAAHRYPLAAVCFSFVNSPNGFSPGSPAAMEALAFSWNS